MSIDRAAILALLTAGRSRASIAKEIGCSRQYVQQLAKQAGITSLRLMQCPECGWTNIQPEDSNGAPEQD